MHGVFSFFFRGYCMVLGFTALYSLITQSHDGKPPFHAATSRRDLSAERSHCCTRQQPLSAMRCRRAAATVHQVWPRGHFRAIFLNCVTPSQPAAAWGAMALGRPPPWRARRAGAVGCLAAALLCWLLAGLACAADPAETAGRLEDWVTSSSVADALQLRVPEPPPVRVTVNLVLIGFDNVTTANVAPAERLLADHLESLEPSQRHHYLFVRPDGTVDPTRPAAESTLTYQYWYGSKGARGSEDN